MRKTVLLLVQVIFLFAIMVAGFTSCTTSDSDSDSIEGELNSEFDDIEGGGSDLEEGDESEIADSDDDFEDDLDSDDGSTVASGSSDDDFDDDMSDDDFEDEESSVAGSGSSGSSEFAAEDSASP